MSLLHDASSLRADDVQHVTFFQKYLGHCALLILGLLSRRRSTLCVTSSLTSQIHAPFHLVPPLVIQSTFFSAISLSIYLHTTKYSHPPLPLLIKEQKCSHLTSILWPCNWPCCSRSSFTSLQPSTPSSSSGKHETASISLISPSSLSSFSSSPSSENLKKEFCRRWQWRRCHLH